MSVMRDATGFSMHHELRVSTSNALCVIAAFALTACYDAPRNTDQAPVAALQHPEWTRKATLYEVNIRQYTPEGTFAAFQRHLPRLDSLGVDILWIMPVQPIGKKNRKGSLGSYYSIADYTATNPEFGSTADFKRLVDEAHKQGFKVILDWVPNHTAFDHTWATQHKDYYTLRPDGSISVARDAEGKETDWTDVADLNYDNRQMRRAMIDAMKWWVDSTGIDGFRVDVAWGVPYDFWTEMRATLDSARPGMFFLAEAEDPKLHQWFNMTYGWEFHHTLNEVAQGKKPTRVLDEYFEKQARTYPTDAMRMYFTSNHDENSWQGTEFERMGPNHQAAFVIAATIQNGMPLLYTGQEVSMNKRLRFFEKDTVNWKGQSLVSFYRSMFELKESQPALANGGWGGRHTSLRTNGGNSVSAFTRSLDSNVVVVAVNFGDNRAALAYQGFSNPGTYTDWFTKAKVPMGPSGNLEVPAHGYRVLVKP
jgi:glycosidase